MKTTGQHSTRRHHANISKITRLESDKLMRRQRESLFYKHILLRVIASPSLLKLKLKLLHLLYRVLLHCSTSATIYTFTSQLNPPENSLDFFVFFCGDKSPFCGATGALCFGLRLTLPMGFKARVDAPSPNLDVSSLSNEPSPIDFD